MEKLALTCQVFYDNDLLDKQKLLSNNKTVIFN
jgi:hypothetical protein